MGQSLAKNYIHIIFSTKHHKPFIYETIEKELYSYIGGICNNLECHTIIVGGYREHVHILCMLSKKITLMKLLEDIKSHSSKWIKTKDEKFKNFYWQNGYGAFSVSPSEVNEVKAYIENQKEHHKKMTFEEELLGFLKMYNVDYDERYLWD